MQWSVLATGQSEEGGTTPALRRRGVIDGEPSDLGRIEPGQTVRLGVTRYQTVSGGYDHAMYAFRAFLDENGCRFPKGFDPPVHWEQLYDMEGAWDDRPHRYTKAILEKEAEKGVAYSCEALYLDPGWDTGFATFLWGDMARTAEGVRRRNAVEIRAESLAAHAAGLVDVDRLADGAGHCAGRPIRPRQPARRRRFWCPR